MRLYPCMGIYVCFLRASLTGKLPWGPGELHLGAGLLWRDRGHPRAWPGPSGNFIESSPAWKRVHFHLKTKVSQGQSSRTSRLLSAAPGALLDLPDPAPGGISPGISGNPGTSPMDHPVP